MSWWDTWGDTITEVGGSLLGGWFESESGDKNRQIAFEDAEKIIALLDQYNNPNQIGLFGGWQNQIGPDGRLTQTQIINPNMAEGIGHFMGQFNQGGQDPQMDTLKNAMFEKAMAQSGPNPIPQRRPRPMTRDQYRDEEGNSIAPSDWWRG